MPDQPVALADDAIPLSPTFAKLRAYTLAQVEASGDAQLVQAIRDVAGQE